MSHAENPCDHVSPWSKRSRSKDISEKTGPREAESDSTSRYDRIDGVQDKKLTCCWNTTATAIPSLWHSCSPIEFMWGYMSSWGSQNCSKSKARSLSRFPPSKIFRTRPSFKEQNSIHDTQETICDLVSTQAPHQPSPFKCNLTDFRIDKSSSVVMF